jgi:hypothetical protein
MRASSRFSKPMNCAVSSVFIANDEVLPDMLQEPTQIHVALADFAHFSPHRPVLV